MILKEIIKWFLPWKNQDKKIYKIYKKSRKCILKGNKFWAYHCSHKIYKKYGCCISPKADIGKNIMLPHPIGIVIGEGVKIGDNCTIYQNVTLGRKNKDAAEYPTIEDDVTIYCNSTVVGDVTIGNGTVIGCNSIVLKSVEPNSKCVGVVK